MKKTIAERLVEIRERGALKRVSELGNIDVEARTVEIAFSSEVEYERWFGIEILDHSQGAADLSRLNNAAAVLWMHDWSDQRGVVESARIDIDLKGRAVVRFSRSEEGEQLFQDVIDKIVTKVSVGYLVNGMKLEELRGDMDVYRVTDWQPYELSFVSIPADDTVGVGRSLEKPQEDENKNPTDNTISKQNLTVARTINEAKKTMNEKVLRDPATGHMVRAQVDDAGNIVKILDIIERAGEDAAIQLRRGMDSVRENISRITAMGAEYDQREMAARAIADGKSPEEFQRMILAEFTAKRAAQPLNEQVSGTEIGMTDKEVRAFSIMRAIRALSDPRDQKAQKDAGLEIEASRAAAEKYGKAPKGLIIPADVLMRSFSTTTPSGGPGSNIVATELLSGSFIELLRHKTWVMKRARTLAGLIGNVDIPRQNAAGAAYWVGEGGSPTGSQPGVDQIALTPKTIGATTDITRRLLLQSTPDAEALVRDDLLKVVALEIDRVAIYGTGSANMPMGLKNITGINAQSFATAAAPTFAELVNMETQIALEDADVDAMSYSFNAGIRGYAKTALKFPGTAASGTIWEPGKTVNGYDTNVSNQIASGDVFFGNWMDMIIAMWGGLELTVDPYALSTSGGIRLVVLQDLDINIRHVQSFCYGTH